MRTFLIILLLLLSPNITYCQEQKKEHRFSIIVINKAHPRVRHFSVKTKQKEQKSTIDVLLCGSHEDDGIPLKITLVNNGEPARPVSYNDFLCCAKFSYKSVIKFEPSYDIFATDYIREFSNKSSFIFRDYQYENNYNYYIVYEDEIKEEAPILFHPVTRISETIVHYDYDYGIY